MKNSWSCTACSTGAAPGSEPRQASSRLRPLQVRVLNSTPRHGGRSVVHSVLDAMLASTFDALEEVEPTLDALAATRTDGDTLVPQATLRTAATRLATMRRSVTAEEAVLARVAGLFSINLLAGACWCAGSSPAARRDGAERFYAPLVDLGPTNTDSRTRRTCVSCRAF